MRYLTDGKTKQNKSKRYVAIGVGLAFMLTVGFFVGRFTATNCALFCASMSPPVFSSNKDECIFMKGRVICMPSDETTADF